MRGNYKESCQKCMEALRDFRDEVNEFLPNTAGGDDYEYPWDMEDANIVGMDICNVIDSILDTDMYDHYAYELSTVRNDYMKFLKEGSIQKCQRVLNSAMKELAIVHEVCKRFLKQAGEDK